MGKNNVFTYLSISHSWPDNGGGMSHSLDEKDCMTCQDEPLANDPIKAGQLQVLKELLEEVKGKKVLELPKENDKRWYTIGWNSALLITKDRINQKIQSLEENMTKSDQECRCHCHIPNHNTTTCFEDVVCEHCIPQPNTGDVTEDWEEPLDMILYKESVYGNPNHTPDGWSMAKEYVKQLLANQRQEIVGEIRKIENPFDEIKEQAENQHYAAETMKYIIIGSLTEEKE